jgi:hypothetical protein
MRTKLFPIKMSIFQSAHLDSKSEIYCKLPSFQLFLVRRPSYLKPFYSYYDHRRYSDLYVSDREMGRCVSGRVIDRHALKRMTDRRISKTVIDQRVCSKKFVRHVPKILMDHYVTSRAFDRHVSKIVIDRCVSSREIERHVNKIFTDQLSVR